MDQRREVHGPPYGSMHDGNQVQLWDCSNNPNQNWNTGYMYAVCSVSVILTQLATGTTSSLSNLSMASQVRINAALIPPHLQCARPCG